MDDIDKRHDEYLSRQRDIQDVADDIADILSELIQFRMTPSEAGRRLGLIGARLEDIGREEGRGILP